MPPTLNGCTLGTYARFVPERIIDGDGWIADRLKFLRACLSENLADDERQAIEAEIEALSKEGGIMPGGWRVPRIFRPLRRKG